MDNNGVPWYREKVDGRVVHFKVQEDGKYPYSYSKQTVGGTARDTQIVVLDDYLGTVQRVQTVSPLTVTDQHDFVVKKNGNYVLLAYEPAQRDLSAFNDENGDPYATDEAVRGFGDPGSHPGRHGGVPLEFLGPHGHRKLQDSR